MAEEKEKQIPKSFRLPASQVEVIDRLVKRKIFGNNGSAVVRWLLTNAIKELAQTDLVKKHREMLRDLDDDSLWITPNQTETPPKISES